MTFELKTAEQPLPIAGIKLATQAAGIRKSNVDDVLLVTLSEDCVSAGIFTRNKFCAAPVVIAQDRIKRTEPRALIFNAGNANAGTGDAGVEDARAVTRAVAVETGCTEEEVLPFSTGIIGERLDPAKFVAVIPALAANLADANWVAAASAIMTTDTVAKFASLEISIEDTIYRVTGITKGSGMIHPDMATMLAFIATDANIPANHLQAVLSNAAERSFNRITVDGDTSTNDSCVLTSSGTRYADPLDPGHPHWDAVVSGIEQIFETLAKAIVRDGEGATKFVEVLVEGPREDDCRTVATTIAQSPLVKTALFASDPNWGRILAAIGRAPVSSLSLSEVSIWLGDYQIVGAGERVPDYLEARAAAVMAGDDISIRVRLGEGRASTCVWTCDLSYDYVRINAEYRS